MQYHMFVKGCDTDTPYINKMRLYYMNPNLFLKYE